MDALDGWMDDALWACMDHVQRKWLRLSERARAHASDREVGVLLLLLLAVVLPLPAPPPPPAGCTGTDVGTCSPGRAVYTLEQLYLQSMISQKTHAAIEVACADSLAYTQANPECQRLLLLAGKEAGPYDNYNVHDTCGPWSAIQAEHGTVTTTTTPC